MKKIYMLATAALMFAACSSNDILEGDATQKQNLPDGAVNFDAYIQRGVTRAGWVGTVTGGDTGLGESTSDKTKLGSHGFGVFGYYTDNNEYDPQSLPNFFYNQKVWAQTTNGVFVYEPLKYWPNEYGNNAISDDQDKVTFFAYAPYVEVVPSTGKIKETGDATKWGITGMSRNIASGDPLIKYLVSFDQDKMVDLCWGVCDNPVWATINDGNKSLNEGEKGKPWINVERPLSTATSQPVKFTFKHALSQLNVTADTYNDGTTAQSIDGKSRIYIRSITFTGFATKGTLNLNNEIANKAQWLDYNGTAELESGEEVTIYDGRKDGKEGTAGGVATNEKVLGLNPMFVQDENQLVNGAFINTSGYHTGVDGTERNVFRKFNGTEYVEMAAGDPILVIPTGEKVKVTIVYDVETPSANLGVYLSDGKTAGSTIENRIEKEVDFGTNGMENGKKYTIRLHLGMNSVKFDADVTGWQDNYMSNDINLPSNTPEFMAGTSAEYNYVVPAAGVNPLNIKLTGFNGGDLITISKDDPGSPATSIVKNHTGEQADAAGMVDASFTVEANNTVKNLSGWVKWAGSGKQVKLSITQTAHALELGTVPIVTDADGIILTSGAENINWATDVLAANIKVTRNGVEMARDDATAPGAGKFYWNASDNKIVLNDDEHIKDGEVFVITVKAGDAAAETITRSTLFAYAASGSPGSSYPYNVAANFTGDIGGILLSGFNSGEDVSASSSDKGTGGTASAAGTVEVTIKGITANTKVVNVTQNDYVTFAGTSGNSVQFNLVQAFAQPDAEKTEVTFITSDNLFKIDWKDAAGTVLSGDVWAEGGSQNVTVISGKYKASGESTFTPMTPVTGTNPSGKLQFRLIDDGTKKGIKVGSGVASTDTYEFVIKAGDAEPITVTKAGLW